MPQQPSLRSQRLLMRPWRTDDYPAFAALNADRRVANWLGGPLAREASDLLADRISAHIDEHGWGLWALELPGKNGFIGFTGLSRPRFDAAFTPCVEVGWRIEFNHWGRGYATEAARMALQFGFSTLSLPEIVSFTTTDNVRSRAVMERVGMSHDPGDDFEHPGLPEGHPQRPHVLYRLRAPYTASGAQLPANRLSLSAIPKG